MNKKTIKDINIKGKRALVRVDYNVSLDDGFKIGDDFRIRQTIPTLEFLLKNNCTIFLLSHFGRPNGKINKKYSLRPVANHLEKIIKRKVYFFDKDYISKSGQKELKKFQSGDIVLLENIRFYSEEEENDKQFAKKLSLLADIFVNDAFGVCHRHHVSIVGTALYLPSVAGFLLDKEIRIISQAVNNPKKPLIAIIGGSKLKDKLNMIGRLIDKADYCLVGGKIANAFLKVKKTEFNHVILNKKIRDLIKQIFWRASESRTALILPLDAVISNGKACDIGLKTRKKFKEVISQAKTIIWVGPMGVYEKKVFSHGTDAIYKAISDNRASVSIVGGGNTIAALKRKRYLKTIDHVSTGGGAMLEFIEKGTLPGIEALKEKP